MAITDPLVLPGDVVLVPVETLPEAVRAHLGWQAGDWAISRPGSRVPSRLLDAASAELVRGFREPTTIVEAVVRYSRGRREDAERALDEAFPLLQRLWAERFLAEAGSQAAERIRASFAPGEVVGSDGGRGGGGWEVVSCVQQLADSELYQVRGRARGFPAPPLRQDEGETRGPGWAALKIERRAGATGPLIEREAAILSHLAGSPAGAPRLLGAGEHEGRRFLTCQWCAGIDAGTAAAELREWGAAGRGELLALVRAVLRAYAALHERGVVHGDVHPRNVLVSAAGGVRLIDFGLARWRWAPADEPEPGVPAASVNVPGGAPERGGVGFFYEPEYAAAALAGAPAPAATRAGEQYALGAMLYLMASGEHYLDFSLERERMLRQVLEQPPLPFSARGVEPWPELESLLARALAKEGRERFAGVAEMAAAAERVRPRAMERARPAAAATSSGDRPVELAGARPAPGERPPEPEEPEWVAAERGRPPAPERTPRPAASARSPRPAASALLDRFLARTAPESELLAAGPPPPAASINFGAAGVACALLRIASARGDAELLSRADLWSVRAAGLAGEDAFYSRALDITPQTVGRVSPYHTASGVWAAAALVAHARNDLRARAEATARFVAAATTGAAAGLDLTLGRSGLLLAASLLLATATPEEKAALIALGGELLGGLWRELDTLSPAGGPALPGRSRPDASRRVGDLASPGGVAPGGRLEPSSNPAPGRRSPLEVAGLNLGVAHGWAGCLYATLSFCRCAGALHPAGLERRLAELAEAAEPWGRGLRWRWRGDGEPGEAGWMPGWCNGSAGFVFLWTLAERRLGDPLYGRLAEGAAWNAWEDEGGGADLCCGLAGRSYALMNLYRHQGGEPWLDRARRLGEQAAHEIARQAGAPDGRPDSLYKGEAGVAALAADLERPAGAALPFFEDEGWLREEVDGPASAR
jgi:serine/threonine protein kinase